MRARVNFTNHITILAQPYSEDSQTCCKDITPEFIDRIASDRRIKWVQIIGEMPEEAYPVMDAIFERRSDLYFRIFNISADRTFDLSVLKLMPHLERVRIDGNLKDNQNAVNIEELAALPNLKGLHLVLFDRRDYSFIKELPETLEELIINIDTMSGSGDFSCEWLLRFPKLNFLWLGKNADRQLESIAQFPELRSLVLRGIEVKDYSFLKKIGLEKFAMMYCGGDISGIGELVTLKELRLWRISKLENIDFIRPLENLEVLKLRDLSNITALPDLSKLSKLREIDLDGVPIKDESLDENTRKLIRRLR